MNSDSYSTQTPAVIQNKLPNNPKKHKMNSTTASDDLFTLVRRQKTHLIKKVICTCRPLTVANTSRGSTERAQFRRYEIVSKLISRRKRWYLKKEWFNGFWSYTHQCYLKHTQQTVLCWGLPNLRLCSANGKGLSGQDRTGLLPPPLCAAGQSAARQGQLPGFLQMPSPELHQGDACAGVDVTQSCQASSCCAVQLHLLMRVFPKSQDASCCRV